MINGHQRVGRRMIASMLILKQQLLSGNSAGQVPGYQAVVKTHMHVCNVNIIHVKNYSALHHDHQKKKSFHHPCNSNMASWNIVFYIGFRTSTERSAKGKEDSRGVP